MLWEKQLFQELGIKKNDYKVVCDSKTALDFSKNSMYYSRTKHIDIRYHWINEVMEVLGFVCQHVQIFDNYLE